MLNTSEFNSLKEQVRTSKAKTAKEVMKLIEQFVTRETLGVRNARTGVEIRKAKVDSVIERTGSTSNGVTMMTPGLSEQGDAIRKRIRNSH